MALRGLQAERVTFKGHGGDQGEAYDARPSGKVPFPGVRSSARGLRISFAEPDFATNVSSCTGGGHER